MNDKHITIVGFQYYNNEQRLRVNEILTLIKEPSNNYDNEAIRVETDTQGKIGYIANSPRTVFSGTMSAGRIYDKIDAIVSAKVIFASSHSAIAEIIDDSMMKGTEKISIDEQEH